ncbi:MAG: ABC transporter ATP-binding protein [Oscillospiraceae bacterium]|jgi:branched-chain amino acid transport system ATP-binding protein|nr:ABC transporter ATP-binding protein [Oscillospiraceae bacterium]MCI9588731.1 ABC transporter ATP-binding protein [Oscillospiraceae bacterium]
MSKNILETQGIGIQFGGLKAVNNVNFTAGEGEITALIGPNGAGKTTLFNLIAGFYAPTAGKVFFKGEDITSLKPYQRTRIGLARTFQNINLFADMSVMDNALVGQHCRMTYDPISAMLSLPNKHKQERASRKEVMEMLDFMGLADVAEEKAGSLSYGKQKNLEIARAMATRPELLLLDEPASGLNTQELDQLSQRVLAMRDRGITVVLIEHKMDVVMTISHKVMVLNFGETIAFGPPEAVSADPHVIEAYLGKEDDEDA